MYSPARMFLLVASAALTLGVSACGGGNTDSNVKSPGQQEGTKMKVLEAGAAVLQDKPPIDALNAYLNGFHFYNGNILGQMEAHHYCAILNEDLIQCVIYDGNRQEARLMGVEYILSPNFSDPARGGAKQWHVTS